MDSIDVSTTTTPARQQPRRVLEMRNGNPLIILQCFFQPTAFFEVGENVKGFFLSLYLQQRSSPYSVILLLRNRKISSSFLRPFLYLSDLSFYLAKVFEGWRERGRGEVFGYVSFRTGNKRSRSRIRRWGWKQNRRGLAVWLADGFCCSRSSFSFVV